jgi:hypothetical protein
MFIASVDGCCYRHWNTWKTFPGSEYCIIIEKWLNNVAELKVTENKRLNWRLDWTKKIKLKWVRMQNIQWMHNKQYMSTVLKRHSRGFYCEPSGLFWSSTLRSDGSQSIQAGGWTSCEAAKDVQGRGSAQQIYSSILLQRLKTCLHKSIGNLLENLFSRKIQLKIIYNFYNKSFCLKQTQCFITAFI